MSIGKKVDVIMEKVLNYTIPLGMASACLYFVCTLFTTFIWSDYNIFVSNIGLLTADTNPYSIISKVIMTIYCICLFIFAVTMAYYVASQYHPYVMIGYLCIALSAVVTFLSCVRYPLKSLGDMTVFENKLHILLFCFMIFLLCCSCFLIIIGYRNTYGRRKMAKKVILFCSSYILVAILNFISVFANWKCRGLFQILIMYSIELLVSYLSFYHFGEFKRLCKSVKVLRR